MDLSEKLRALRKQKHFTLKGLALKSGVGIATLARLEKGTHKGTFKTHQKIAEALEVDMVELYKDIERPDEITASTVPEIEKIEAFHYNDKASSIILTPNVLRKNMLPVLITLQPKGKTSQEQNPKGTEKFLFCLDGKIQVIIQDKTFNLSKGSVLYFKSSFSHYFKNTGKTKAKCLCISNPVAL